jgi:hypothetical protein
VDSGEAPQLTIPATVRTKDCAKFVVGGRCRMLERTLA